MSDILRRAFDRAVLAAERRAWTPGRLGMTNADGTVTISVPDRPNWVYVALGPDGSQGVTVARNDAGVPLRVHLPVKMRREESGVMAIQGVYNAGGLADVGATDTPIVTEYGVPSHPHTHGELAGLTDDDHTQYPLLAGRSGGQTIYGGTASGDDLTLESTSHATKGAVDIQPNGGATTVGGTLGVSGNAAFSGNVGIGTTSPASLLDVNGSNATVKVGQLNNAGTVGYEFKHTLNVKNAIVSVARGSWGRGQLYFIQDIAADNDSYELSDAVMAFVDGNVGIGTPSPSYKLDVSGDINASGSVRSNGTPLTSDGTLKDAPTPTADALTKLAAVRGYEFTWSDKARQMGLPEGTQHGLIAQEVEQIFPDLVSEWEVETGEYVEGENGEQTPMKERIKCVDYARMVPILLEAVHELAGRVDALTSAAKA